MRPRVDVRLGFLLLAGCLTACIAANAERSRSTEPFAALRDRMVAQMLDDSPELGRTMLGDHRYDGRVGDCSEAGFTARLARVDARLKELSSVRADGLSANDALDLALLRASAERDRFHLADLDSPHTRPDVYLPLFDVSSYLEEYAPLDDRLARVVQHEEAALGQVEHVLENLRPPLSAAIAAWQAPIYAGKATELRGLADTFNAATDAAQRERFRRANSALAEAADRISAALGRQARSGDQSHVLGAERYQRFLEAEEGITTPLPEFKREAEQNLERDLRAFRALAPSVTPTQLVSAQLLAANRQAVDDAHAFVLAHHLVTLPPDLPEVLIEASPPSMRWNGAQLTGSGEHPVLLITLPDQRLSAELQTAFVPDLGVVRINAAHETFPGHLVQAVWGDHAPSAVQRLAFDAVFNEGWAHYAEQLMVEEGFDADRPATRLGQLSEALRRDCRCLASIGIHAESMTLKQAESLFVERCQQDAETARMNALRATFDPGYFAYSVGKLQLVALRDEARHLLGPRFSLQKFHDAVLAHGRPPVALLRPVVLRELGAVP